MAKRLLVLTYHFPPSAATGSYRLLGLARHLPRLGWDVIVIAPPCTPYEPQDAELGQEVPAETVVLSPPYPEMGWGKLARRLAPHGVWLPAALLACERALSRYRPAALLTSSPPHAVHLGGYAIKLRHRLPWVADFRDPWLDHDSPATSHGLSRCWNQFWEQRVFQAADRVIANTPNASRTLRQAYPQHARKIAMVTNGFDPDRFDLSAARTTGPIRLLHTGELYWGRDPRPLLTALGDVQEQRGPGCRQLEMQFLGQLNIAGFVADEHVRRPGLAGAVTFEGHVPYRQALTRMVQADILVLIASPEQRHGVPAKLYEYLGARRPILALAEPGSDTAWVLRESGVLYRLAPPGDAAAIRAGLLDLLKQIETAVPGPPALPERLYRFTRQHMAERVAELLDECAGEAKQFEPAGAK